MNPGSLVKITSGAPKTMVLCLPASQPASRLGGRGEPTSRDSVRGRVFVMPEC